MARKLKIMENEKHPLDDLKNDHAAPNADLCPDGALIRQR